MFNYTAVKNVELGCKSCKNYDRYDIDLMLDNEDTLIKQFTCKHCKGLISITLKVKLEVR